jgi:cytochrome d ubiquinol oxidase subunit II
VALGNVVYGVPLDNKMEFTGNFFTLLRPVPLLFGVAGLAAVLLQGASYAVMKTEGDVRKRSFQAVNILLVVNAVTAVACYLMMSLTFKNITENPLFYAAVVITLLGLMGIFFSAKKKNEKALFWESSFSIAGLWLAVGAAHFPNMIKAVNDPGLSITIYNSSTGLHTLKIMSIIALVGMPIVIAYTIFVYKIFKGKASAGDY